MKNLVLVVMIFIFSTLSVSAQTNWQVDTQTLMDKSKSSLVGVFTNHNLSDENNFHIWSYLGISPGWGEALIGPSISFGSDEVYTEIGIGGGVEQPDFTPRFGVYGFFVANKISGFAFAEYGNATGGWYLATLDFPIYENFSAGLYGQRYVGIGPRIQFTKDFLSVWAAPIVFDYEGEQYNTSIGMTIRF